MIHLVLERFFDYLFQYLVNCLTRNADARQISDRNDFDDDLNENRTITSVMEDGDDDDDDLSHDDRNDPHDDQRESLSQSPDCHIQVCYMDSNARRMVNYEMTIKRSMKVKDVKRQLHHQLNQNVDHWSNLAILFMGRELPNNLEISGCDLGDYSMLHVLDSGKVRKQLQQQQQQQQQQHKIEQNDLICDKSENGNNPNNEPQALSSSSSSSPTTVDDHIEHSATEEIPISRLPNKLTAIEEAQIDFGATSSPLDTADAEDLTQKNNSTTTAVSNHQKLYFFVHCQSCGGLRHGKLRVACVECSRGSILFERDPQDWNDVLRPGRIPSHCFTPDCRGAYARFYFKCIDENRHTENSAPPSIASTTTTTTTDTAVVPLNRIRRNNIDACCLACLDARQPVVVVFPRCDHVICLDCFADYCRTSVSERNISLIENEPHEYTVNCPLDCAESWIESAHLRLLDPPFYAMYRKFAEEEAIFQAGGILCPYSGCDQPYFPRRPDDSVIDAKSVAPISCEVTECAKCRLVFCVRCTYEGVYAPETCSFDSLIERTNATIRGNGNADATTNETGTVLAGLIEKFATLRRSLIGADTAEPQAPRWQDTMSRLKIREIAKPCPKCRTPTERSGGCMHMVCTRKRCNHNWCWICLTEWSSDCMASHWFG